MNILDQEHKTTLSRLFIYSPKINLEAVYYCAEGNEFSSVLVDYTIRYEKTYKKYENSEYIYPKYPFLNKKNISYSQIIIVITINK